MTYLASSTNESKTIEMLWLVWLSWLQCALIDRGSPYIITFEPSDVPACFNELDPTPHIISDLFILTKIVLNLF